MSEVILRDYDDPKLTEYADNIQSSADQLLDLINGILDFSKIESGKVTLLNAEYRVDEFFKDMPAEDQAILKEAAATATEYARQASDERISDRVSTIEASGTEILKIDEKTRQAIIEASSAVREQIRSNVDPAIFDAYIK